LTKSLTNSEITSISEKKKVKTYDNDFKVNIIETDDILKYILDNNEKYDFIIIDDNFEDALGFSIASICFKNLLNKSGIMGLINSPMSFNNINLFIQRNKESINILHNEKNVFIEKIDIF
jgi:spermidine synthase